jgi:O-glycosyl hydrolase
MKITTLFLYVLSCGLLYGQTTIIRIDKTKNYQKIDGFGGFGMKNVAWHGTDYWDQNFVNTMVNDLGATIIRHEIDPSFEQVNDNSDPFVTDLSKFNLNGPSNTNSSAAGCAMPDCSPVSIPGVGMRSIASPSGSTSNGQLGAAVWFQYMKAVYQTGLLNGDTIKFLGTAWSPPSWMKYVNATTGTDRNWNRLIAGDFKSPCGNCPEQDLTASWNLPVSQIGGINSDSRPLDRRDEYAEMLSAYSQLFKSVTGTNLYAIGLGNEPAFAQDFQSCVWSSKQFAAQLRSVGKRFKRDNVATKLIWSEDIGDKNRYEEYIKAVVDNDSIRPYGNITAVHAYNATGTAAGSSSAELWNDMHELSNYRGYRPFWMTETSGYGLGIDGAMNMNNALYVALKYGKASAWIWWQNSQDGAESTYALISGSGATKSKRYFVSKQYYKYVRPGAISVDCDPMSGNSVNTTSGILALAFQHPQKQTLTVVLTNSSTTTSENVNFNFINGSTAPDYYEVYRTSASQDCAFLGTISGSFTSYALPAQSVTTFYGKNSNNVIIPPVSIDIHKPDFSFIKALTVPGSVQLSATVLPLSVNDKQIKWSILSGSEFASITEDGFVQSYKSGNVTIKAAFANDTTLFKTINLIVRGDVVIPRSFDFSLYDDEFGEVLDRKLNKQRGYYILSNVTPSDANNYTTSYSSNSESILSVNNNDFTIALFDRGEVIVTGFLVTPIGTITGAKSYIVENNDDNSNPDPITSLNSGLKENMLEVFPNPANEKITIRFNSTKDFSGEVFLIDSFGKTLCQKTASTSSSSNLMEIDLKDYSSGIYLIKAGKLSQKIVIQKY